MLVSICIITLKRPEGLKRLLNGIKKLTFNNFPSPEIEVIVIDNDSDSSAKKICEEIKFDFPWQLKYDIEPIRGITYARNKAISFANKKTDFIAIIDDDEVPEYSWLEQLLIVQQRYDADIVTGPALPYFPSDNVPQWIKKGNFFDHSRHQTGERRHVAFTNNVLIRGKILRQLDTVFDNRFALTGGEDAHLFLRLNQAGYKIIWADEALVNEWIPASRINAQWILKRGYRGWSDHSLIEKELYPSFKVQFLRACKGLTLMVIGVIKLLFSLFQAKHKQISSLLYIYRGLGTIAGLLSMNHYQEYQQIHSDFGVIR